MDLILNNLKGLGIHLLMSVLSIILTLVGVMLSPIYSSQVIAITVAVFVYIIYLVIYLKLSNCLKLENNKRNDYMVGVLAFIVGLGIWGLSIYYSGCSMNYISESQAIYWMPYNVYIFAGWVFLYGQENALILLLGSLSPIILLSVGMKIRRYKYRLNK